jgi:crotonobetainyl-CoA:carnitine CoA-transferase CaiB-like acyl-CoA transferase
VGSARRHQRLHLAREEPGWAACRDFALSGLIGLLNVQAQRYLSLGEIPAPNGNAHPVISPYGSYETADGPLNIATATQDMWRKLAECLGLEALIDDPRFVDNTARFANRDPLKTLR